MRVAPFLLLSLILPACASGPSVAALQEENLALRAELKETHSKYFAEIIAHIKDKSEKDTLVQGIRNLVMPTEAVQGE